MVNLTSEEESWAIVGAAANFKMVLNSWKGDIYSTPFIKAAELAIGELNEAIEAAQAGNYEGMILEISDCLNFIKALSYQAVLAHKNRKKEGLS